MTIEELAVKEMVEFIQENGIIELLEMHEEVITKQGLLDWVMGTADNYGDCVAEFGITYAHLFTIKHFAAKICKELNKKS